MALDTKKFSLPTKPWTFSNSNKPLLRVSNKFPPHLSHIKLVVREINTNQMALTNNHSKKTVESRTIRRSLKDIRANKIGRTKDIILCKK